MRWHIPKPLHGWRAFLGEVGVIVLGVLIALAAQQAVEDWQWSSDVRAADRRMSEEIAYDVALAYERIAIDSCLRGRLAELRDELLKSDPSWTGSRVRLANDVYRSDFPAVYRTPDRPWLQASWLTALNEGLVGHFGRERAEKFAALFDNVVLLKQIQSEETETAETLGDLAFASQMTPAERRANLKIVARLDALNTRMLFDARVLIDNAREAGIDADPRALKRQLNQQRSYRGTCVHDPRTT